VILNIIEYALNMPNVILVSTERRKFNLEKLLKERSKKNVQILLALRNTSAY
jgi:hypothetical protein